MESDKFRAANSDDRFALLFAALAPRKARSPRPSMWTGDDGKKVARIERQSDRVTVSVDDKIAPRFGDYLIAKLPDLYRAFREERE
jgi:ParB family transcriptional regulator, chromosome partitioning protein